MMYAREYLVAERTLLGAVDSFLKSTVHVRPQLIGRFETISEMWIDAWLEEGGENRLDAVDSVWMSAYLARLDEDERDAVLRFFTVFYTWAVRENLVDVSPLANYSAK